MSSSDNGHASRWWSRPWGRAREQGLVAYRRLALQLHYDLQDADAGRSALLATPTGSALCAHASALLACCLAEELGRRVLLVDASPRRPDISKLLECDARPGFAEVMADPALDFEDYVVGTTHENVAFLPAGREPRGSAGRAPYEGIEALLKAADNDYGFSVLFGRSVLDDSAALAVAPHVGCVLLLAVEKETTMTDLDAAQAALANCKARKVGLVLTTPFKGRRWTMKSAAEH